MYLSITRHEVTTRGSSAHHSHGSTPGFIPDMITPHTSGMKALQPTHPDYTNVNCSILTQREMDVCDPILRAESEEIKHHPIATYLDSDS